MLYSFLKYGGSTILLILYEFSLVKGDCPLDTFPCGDGDCIDKRFVCDQVIDCRRLTGEIEGRDEIDCTKRDYYCDRSRFRSLPETALFRLADTGYNVANGGYSSVRMFQSERYIGECRTVERILRDGSKVTYLLPYNLLKWSFFDERLIQIPQFRAEIYESAYEAYVAIKKQRGAMSITSSMTYENLYTQLEGPFEGNTLTDYLRTNMPLLESGYPFARLHTRVVTGTFEIRSPDQLTLHRRLFVPELMRAIGAVQQRDVDSVIDEQKLVNIFQRFGTHFISGGSFGGSYEIHLYRGNCNGAKSGAGNSGLHTDPPILPIKHIALCARTLLQLQVTGETSSWNVSECAEVIAALPDRLGPRKYDLHTSCHASGGNPRLAKGLETVAVLRDLPSALPRKDFILWMDTLNENPAPLEIRLSPICDLITSNLSATWGKAKLICEQILLKYIEQCQTQITKECRYDQFINPSSTYSSVCWHAMFGSCFSRRNTSGSCPYIANGAIIPAPLSFLIDLMHGLFYAAVLLGSM